MNLQKWFKEYKSNLSCTYCDANHPAVLDFHHKDPNKKKFDIYHLVKNNSSKKLIIELEKCEPICSNCHRKLHAKKGIFNATQRSYSEKEIS